MRKLLLTTAAVAAAIGLAVAGEPSFGTFSRKKINPPLSAFIIL
jgi:hypothetical protein